MGEATEKTKLGEAIIEKEMGETVEDERSY